jgi:hypothetical protein
MRFFSGTFWRVAKGGPFSVSKWLEFFRWIATHRAFRKYVTETQGIPEGQDPKKPPFEDADGSMDASFQLAKAGGVPVAAL